jgi:hypothetical protein
MNFWQKLSKPFFVLAPMADVTDPAFRRIVAEASRHGQPGGGPDVFWTEFVNNEKLDNKVLNIVPIVDDPDDNVWFEILIKNTGKFDVGVGDNDWVNGILEENKIPVVRVGFYDRKKLEGTEIRKLMKGNKKKWEDRVPSYLVSQLTK